MPGLPSCVIIIRYETYRTIAFLMPKSIPKSSPLTSAQIRAARALLRWSADDLARKSALGIATIRRAEGVDGKTALTVANDHALRRTFEDAGVEFIEPNGGGEGVRLKTHRT